MSRFYSATAQPTTLSAACTNSATTIQVTATTGFPAVEFILALDYGSATQELVKVTNVAGTTLTVVRGFDSTTAQSHAIGAVVTHVHSADDFRLSRTHEAASTGVHGATGALVGTTDAQALTNKDLTAGTNTFPASLATAANLTAHTGATTAHGATGAVVGTTNTQALSNKDLTAGTNTFPTSLATLTGAQTLTNKTLTSPTLTAPTIDTLAGVTGVGQKQYVNKGADQPVTSSTVFVSDSALTVPVVANATYLVEYGLRYTCSVAGGCKAQLIFPAGATFAPGSSALAASPVSVIASASGQTTAQTMNTGPTRLVTGGTAGNLTVQFAQETSDATSTVAKANSFLVVTRVA